MNLFGTIFICGFSAPAAGRCMWGRLKVNYRANVYHNEGTCHSEQQGGSLVRF